MFRPALLAADSVELPVEAEAAGVTRFGSGNFAANTFESGERQNARSCTTSWDRRLLEGHIRAGMCANQKLIGWFCADARKYEGHYEVNWKLPETKAGHDVGPAMRGQLRAVRTIIGNSAKSGYHP